MKIFGVICGCAALWALLTCPVAAQPAIDAWPTAEVARRTLDHPGVMGPLKLGMAQADVQAQLGGPPQSESRRAFMMMSEDYTYTWTYPGVTLYFSAPDETSPGSLLAINAGPPCDWAALGGLKVGLNIDSTSEILKRHGGEGVAPIGSVGADIAGLYFEYLDIAVIARLEGGKIAGLYLGPNLP